MIIPIAMSTALLQSFSIYGIFLLLIIAFIFLISQYKRDNSLMDIVYGPTFLIAGLGSFLSLGQSSLTTYLILICIALWSTRLGLRIYRKNKGAPEDTRYAAWRTLWSEKGLVYFIVRSFLQINLLQGFIILLVASPLIISLAFGDTFPLTFTSWSVLLGLAVFITGLTIESIADYQLDQFIARKKAKTEMANLMTTGLFHYSRRPNYFGETLIWWGLAIIVLPLPFGYLALISPLLITYIVTKVTGPMLENIFLEKYGDEYREYMRKTSYFIPLPPKE
jgi:steroid 5-alpha reductase family enzyme